MQPRRILLVDVDGFAIRRFRAPLVRELIRRGCAVIVAAPSFREPDRSALEDLGAETRTYSLERTGLNPLADLETRRSMMEMMSETSPDAVLCRAAKAVAYGLPAAARANVRTRVGFMTGLGSMFHPEPGLGRITALAGRRLILKGLRQASQVWVMNPDNERTLTRSLGGLQGRTIIDMDSSGVDIDAHMVSPLPKSPTFCFIGRLLPAKGARDFIDAAVRMKDHGSPFNFIVAGEPDSHRSSISAEEMRSLHDRGVVEYLGFVKDTPRLLERCSAFVLPSHHEGRSRSLMEALACGRPVITSDAPGCHDAIEDGREGLVVPVGDLDRLCGAIQSMGEEPERLCEMSEASRRLAEHRYDQHAVARRNADALLGGDEPTE